RALSNQLARIDSRTYLEPFRVHDRELAFRFLDGAPDVRELLQRRDRGLVAEIVLARAHDADAERRSLVRNRCRGDELNGFVFQDLSFAACELYVSEASAKLRDLLLVLCIERDELPAASLDGRRHAVDVRMVETDGGEADGMLGLRQRRHSRHFGLDRP